MQQILKNILKKIKNELENEYCLKEEFIVEARVYLYFHIIEIDIECISALCDISYEEAKAIVENFRNDPNHRMTYIVCVEAMLQKKALEKELTR